MCVAYSSRPFTEIILFFQPRPRSIQTSSIFHSVNSSTVATFFPHDRSAVSHNSPHHNSKVDSSRLCPSSSPLISLIPMTIIGRTPRPPADPPNEINARYADNSQLQTTRHVSTAFFFCNGKRSGLHGTGRVTPSVPSSLTHFWLHPAPSPSTGIIRLHTDIVAKKSRGTGIVACLYNHRAPSHKPQSLLLCVHAQNLQNTNLPAKRCQQSDFVTISVEGRQKRQLIHCKSQNYSSQKWCTDITAGRPYRPGPTPHTQGTRCPPLPPPLSRWPIQTSTACSRPDASIDAPRRWLP